MDRHQLEYFVAIVDHASFTRAAESLNVAQPSLSRAMKNLERELGIELFRRTGREIIVTDVARDLAHRARMIMQDFDSFAAAAHASAGAIGRVEIAATPSTAIEPLTTIVDELRSEHPGMTIAALSTQNAAEVVAAVDNGRCEIGLCGQLSKPAGANITSTLIGHVEAVMITPPGSPLSQRTTITPSALSGQGFVVGPPRTTLRSLFEQVISDVAEYEIAVEVGHRAAIVPMVLRGIGVALHVREWAPLAEQAGAGVSGLEPAVLVPKWLVRRKKLGKTARVVDQVIQRHAEV